MTPPGLRALARGSHYGGRKPAIWVISLTDGDRARRKPQGREVLAASGPRVKSTVGGRIKSAVIPAAARAGGGDSGGTGGGKGSQHHSPSLGGWRLALRGLTRRPPSRSTPSTPLAGEDACLLTPAPLRSGAIPAPRDNLDPLALGPLGKAVQVETC